MQISPRLLEVASRLTGQSADSLKSQVVQSEHLGPEGEQDFADLMADRSQVVAYDMTDPIRTLLGINPRQAAAMDKLYEHSSESRSQGFTLAREIEGPNGPRGFYTVLEEQPGLVELAYREGDNFTRVFVDTTPGEKGEQYLIADLTPTIRQAFGHRGS